MLPQTTGAAKGFMTSEPVAELQRMGRSEAPTWRSPTVSNLPEVLALAERLYEDSLGEEREMLRRMMSSFESVLEEQDAAACEEAAENFRQALRDMWNLDA